jgi:hypothetical protein
MSASVGSGAITGSPSRCLLRSLPLCSFTAFAILVRKQDQTLCQR